MVSLINQAVVTPLISVATLVCHRNWAVQVFNPSPREKYRMGGYSSQTQLHSEIPGGKSAIFGL